MRSLLIVAVLLFAAGCKESPEAAAQRIRDTMAAMQEQEAADEAKRSAELFELLGKNGPKVKDGMTEAEIHKLLGEPVARRASKSGGEMQAWATKVDGKSRGIGLRIVDGKAVDVDFKP